MRHRVIYLRPWIPPRGLSRFAAIRARAERDGIPFVLPACADPAQKHPCVGWKEFQVRPPTADEIADWEKRFADRNGIYLTGPLLGRFIVDCDNRDAAEWVREQGVPTTQVVRTRRGYHLHFRYPDFHVYNPVSKLHPGVDIRGFGGVAVAVDSVHQSGFVYRWANGRSPQDVALAPAPPWLLDWLRDYAANRENNRSLPPRPFQGTVSGWARQAISAELERLKQARPGTRNDQLATVAFKLGQICGAGKADIADVRSALYSAIEIWPDEILKSRSTIDRGLEAGMSNPRFPRTA